jgi:hypothetical protein
MVYGAGRYEGQLFILSTRHAGRNGKPVVANSFLEVPAFYGFHLEHLCYLHRYYGLAWQTVIDKCYDKGEWMDGYQIPAEAMGRTWRYHELAIHAVVSEVERRRDEVHLPEYRLRTLDEWVIREQYDLVYAEEAALKKAWEGGLFQKDILHDAEDFGT